MSSLGAARREAEPGRSGAGHLCPRRIDGGPRLSGLGAGETAAGCHRSALEPSSPAWGAAQRGSQRGPMSSAAMPRRRRFTASCASTSRRSSPASRTSTAAGDSRATSSRSCAASSPAAIPPTASAGSTAPTAPPTCSSPSRARVAPSAPRAGGAGWPRLRRTSSSGCSRPSPCGSGSSRSPGRCACAWPAIPACVEPSPGPS